jgi:hypothetical protein
MKIRNYHSLSHIACAQAVLCYRSNSDNGVALYFYSRDPRGPVSCVTLSSNLQTRQTLDAYVKYLSLHVQPHRDGGSHISVSAPLRPF